MHPFCIMWLFKSLSALERLEREKQYKRAGNGKKQNQ
jgi:hypothetical protein